MHRLAGTPKKSLTRTRVAFDPHGEHSWVVQSVLTPFALIKGEPAETDYMFKKAKDGYHTYRKEFLPNIVGQSCSTHKKA
jgi:hypothetical protein